MAKPQATARRRETRRNEGLARRTAPTPPGDASEEAFAGGPETSLFVLWVAGVSIACRLAELPLGAGNLPSLPCALVDGSLGQLMQFALDEASWAIVHGDVPVGAVVASRSGGVVARRHNERELRSDPTAHAEILAIRDAAAALGRWRLHDCLLVVTLEPCPMCVGAAVAARMDTIAFGATDSKAGACGSLYNLAADPRLNHEITVVAGMQAEESAALLRRFFADRRPAKP
jgi:tRNA(adenine34) deaminase